METLQFPPKPKNFTRAERAFIQALSTLLENQSFDTIHVTDILKLSGFTKGAFYGRFTDKYDFAKKIVLTAGEIHINYLARHSMMKARGFPLDSPRVLANASDFFNFIYDFRALYDIILDQKLTGITLDDFIFAPLRTKPSGGEDLDIAAPHRHFFDYVGIYSSVVYVMYWKRCNYEITPDEMIKLALAYEDFAFNRYSDMGHDQKDST